MSGVRYDNIILNQSGVPVVNAQITVCAGTGDPGTPCSPPTAVFADEATTIVLSQPISTGPLGNFGFYAIPGDYTYSVTGVGVTSNNYSLTLGAGLSNTVPTITGPFPLVVNGNFEENSGIPPVGWEPNINVSSLSYETGAPYEGLQTLKMVSNNNPAGAQVNNTNFFQVNPGDTYYIAAVMKGDGVVSPVITLEFADLNGQGLPQTISASTSANTYVQVSAAGTAPAGAVLGVITLGSLPFGTVGTTWFDAISVYKVNLPGPITISNLNGVTVVDGVHYPKTDAGIAQAINDTPSGGTVYLPVGTYNIVVGGILIPKPITIQGAGKGTVLSIGPGVNNTVNVFEVNPTTDGNLIRFADFQIAPTATTVGRYAIHVFGQSADILGLSIERVLIGQMGDLAGVPNIALFCEGSGLGQGTPVLANIVHNEFLGGIVMNNYGDTVRIKDNQISFLGKLDFSASGGASMLIIEENNITVPGGIHIGGLFNDALMVQIIGNEIENSTGWTGSNGAFIDIDGAGGIRAQNVTIARNSIQSAVIAGVLPVTIGVRVNNADFTNIYGNIFEHGNTGSFDISITANAADTNIGTNIYAAATTTWATRIHDLGVRTSIATQFQGSLMVSPGPNGSNAQGISTLDNAGVQYPLLGKNSVDNTTAMYGYQGQGLITGVNGASHIYDGSGVAGSGQIAGSFGFGLSSPLSSPVVGTSLTVNRMWIQATVFANLGTPGNGQFAYCSDCTVANPCAGGGTGALAKRLNGVWVCN